MDEDLKKETEDKNNDRLLKTRSILISGEINKDQADKVARDLLILDNESNEPIKVFLNSPGGDINSGFAIYDMIRFVKSPVIMIGMGLVASAAAFIILAVPKERRVALPDSSYLIHQPLSEMKGNATEIEIHVRQVEKLKEKINKVISQATGKDINIVEKDTDRDYWMTAEEAVSYGIVGRIISSASEL